ncbi:MAG: hypothetical protein H6Q05_4208, partial [Acidobacteria bacterium]|nr:hypothetical protein [Acidobacteriota bacterium]
QAVVSVDQRLELGGEAPGVYRRRVYDEVSCQNTLEYPHGIIIVLGAPRLIKDLEACITAQTAPDCTVHGIDALNGVLILQGQALKSFQDCCGIAAFAGTSKHSHELHDSAILSVIGQMHGTPVSPR